MFSIKTKHNLYTYYLEIKFVQLIKVRRNIYIIFIGYIDIDLTEFSLFEVCLPWSCDEDICGEIMCSVI